MSSLLHSLDLFRRVPKDLTEASKLGGCISVATVVALVVLFTWELISLMKITEQTRIEVSHREV